MASDTTKHEGQHVGPHPQQPPAHLSEGAPKPPSAQDKAAADKARAEQREATQAASIGAQIILDYNSDGGVGARGGAAGTIEENTALRDAHYIALGLNPAAPSGPPTGEPWEPPAVKEAAAPKHVGPSATRVSSLAAGIQDAPTPPPPAGRAHEGGSSKPAGH